MKRGILIAVVLLLLVPVLLMTWLLHSESGLHWTYRQALTRLPGELTVGELSGRLAGPISLRQVEYLQQDLQVSTAALELRWDPWALLRGEIEIDRLEIDALKITAPAGARADAGPSEISLPDLQLPLSLQLKRIAIDDFEFTQGETRLELEQVLVGASILRDRISLDRVEIIARDFDVALQGTLRPVADYAHELGLQWHYQLPSGARLGGNGRLRGDLRKTALEQSIRGALQLDLKLVLNDALQAPRWRVEARADDFDSATLDATLPSLTGAARIDASGDLESARVEGEIKIDSGLPLPLDARFSLARVAANADRSGLIFDDLRLRTEDGEVDASGEVAWTPAIAWRAQIKARNLNPVRIAPEWPGQIDARLATSGGIDAGVISTAHDIVDLSGRLRDYSLQMKGKLKSRGSEVEIDGLDLKSGATRLTANGHVGDTLDLRWTLASPNLAELYPDATGRLRASGELLGTRAAPTIKAEFDGNDLALADNRIGRIEGVTRVELLQPQQLALESQRLELRLDARELDLRGQRIESLRIDADNQRIEARLVSALAAANLGLSGSLEGTRWRGKIVDLDIESPKYGSWKLRQPAALALSAERVNLQDACLQTTAGNELCATLDGAGDAWRIDAELGRMPLSWLAEFVPPELRLEGSLDARAGLDYRLPASLHGDIRVKLAPGTLAYRLRPDRFEQIEFGGGEIGLSLAADGISAKADLALRADENLTASLRLPGANALSIDLQQQALRATARANLADLAIVDALIEDIADLRGRAEIELQVDGSLGQPRPQGQASLVDVSFAVPRLQLEITRLSAEAVSRGDNRATYRVDAATADGRLALEGHSLLDANAGWPSELRIDASQLDLASLLKPWLPPDLALEGRVDGKAELALRLPDHAQGTIRIATRGGTISVPLPDGETGSWAMRDTGLNVVLDASGISGDTGFKVGDNSFAATFGLPQARLLTLDPKQQSLQANAEIDFRDLGLLETLLPDLHQVNGRLQVNLAIAGNLAQPGLRGQATLGDASVKIPRLGVDLRRIGLTATAEDADELRFEAMAESGEGSIRMRGHSRLDARAGWPTTIRIEGKDFEASRVPVATVTVSPDLTIKIQQREIDVQGELRVPFARLQPRDITSAATVSTDTVIVGGSKPVEPKWRITSKTSLVLGERVSFFGYGFDGKLDGKLAIEETPGQPTRGSGVINIREGRYRAYGQHLNIQNGRLLFAGGPLTNPGLDIRATRTTGDVVAGVEVGGNLQKPELVLFSSPAMGQTDTLSYLLTGGPLETASSEEGAMMANAALALGLSGGDRIARSIGDRFGFDDLRVESSSSGDQASLVVGRYLSPRLYVSYGVGLIESVNTLNLRYQISSKWRLETESGSEQGADLLYSIER